MPIPMKLEEHSGCKIPVGETDEERRVLLVLAAKATSFDLISQEPMLTFRLNQPRVTMEEAAAQRERLKEKCPL